MGLGGHIRSRELLPLAKASVMQPNREAARASFPYPHPHPYTSHVAVYLRRP